MTARDEFSLECARDAAEHGELGPWVARFLASPGSDNAPLAAELAQRGLWWLGPVQVPLDKLHRLAGPADEPVLCTVDRDYWDDRVDDMHERIEQGWEPPPVIASCRNSHLMLEDGNHRVESLRRSGAEHAWTIIGFGGAPDADGIT